MTAFTDRTKWEYRKYYSLSGWDGVSSFNFDFSYFRSEFLGSRSFVYFFAYFLNTENKKIPLGRYKIYRILGKYSYEDSFFLESRKFGFIYIFKILYNTTVDSFDELYASGTLITKKKDLLINE